MLDGLGFRFYWATEVCVQKIWRSNQVKKPNFKRNYGTHLSMSTMNRKRNPWNCACEPDLTVHLELRRRRWKISKPRVANYARVRPDVKRYPASLSEAKRLRSGVLELVSGPIEDCVWHVGQIVLFRRSSGNPLSEKVNFFTGTVN